MLRTQRALPVLETKDTTFWRRDMIFRCIHVIIQRFRTRFASLRVNLPVVASQTVLNIDTTICFGCAKGDCNPVLHSMISSTQSV